MSSLEQETTRILKKGTEIEKEIKLPEGRKNDTTKKKFIFKPREGLTTRKVRSCRGPTETSSSGCRRKRAKLLRNWPSIIRWQPLCNQYKDKARRYKRNSAQCTTANCRTSQLGSH